MARDLSKRIAALARDNTLADRTPCRTISGESLRKLAEATSMSLRTLEIEALRQAIFPERYLRNRKSLSAEDQIKLLESTVCVVGLGGLGGLVTETAARIGVGRLVLVDGDVFEAHNLNRQLLSLTDRIGVAKASAAERHVAMVNPAVEVTTVPERLTSANAATFIDASLDLAVDCLDNIPSRFDLQTAARRAGVPMVSSAIAGLCGHVTTIFPKDAGLVLIYGPEGEVKSDTGAEIPLGCLAPVVNLVASLASAEIIKVLLGHDHQLRNRLLVVDLNDYTVEALQLC